MKKRFLRWGLMALSMLWLSAGAQTINSAEYFYDTDPGVGNGIAVSPFTAADSVNLNLSLPTTGLSTGAHYLYVRFMYNNGTWGLHEGRQFYCLPLTAIANVKINAAEYFYDTDPGLGNGTAITIPAPTDSSNLNLSLPTTGLQPGIHNLFIRFRHDNGAWGLYQGAQFYILPLAIAANTEKINAAEYFFNTDPGLGNGTAISIPAPTDSANVNLVVPTSGLPAGFHNLFVRFRYANGTWSLHEGRSFYILPVAALANTAKINRAEYFIDTDPGVGNGTGVPVTPAADSANISLVVATTGLAEGFHNLFFRFRYDNGTWGLQEGRTFYILPAGSVANTAKINRAEYFYDTDPGLGNGTAISIATPADTVDQALTLSTSGLSTGLHYLFIRYRYDNGTWGLYEGRPFYVLQAPSGSTAKIDLVEYFFDNDPGIGRAVQIPVAPATDTANLTLGSINVAGLSGGNHYIFFRFRYDNGTWGLYEGRAFSVCTPPAVTVTVGGPTSYCLGGSVTLTSNTASTYTYQWQRNGVDIAGATSNTYTVTDTGGSYTMVITDTSGCYGTSTPVVVTVNSNVSSNITRGICTGGSYNFNGTILTQAGVYYDTIPSSAGCDSTITLTLTVGNVITTTVNQSICSGQSYLFDGRNLTAAGTYRDTVVSIGGCDSIITLNLAVRQSSATPLSASICQGSSYSFKGQQLNASGTYRDTLTNVAGCDSIITLTLTVRPNSGSTLNIGVCTGGSYTFNGQQLTASGTYYDTLASANGCDSLVTLNLQVSSVITTNLNVTICQGGSYPFKGQSLSVAGVYTDSLMAQGGCDSLVVLNLTVEPLPTVTLSGNADTLCTIDAPVTLTGGSPAGGSYSGNGVSSGVFNPATAGNGTHVITYTYISPNNCTGTATETIVVQTCVGIGETYLQNAISLYPNPVEDQLIVESELLERPGVSLMVFDAAGKQVNLSYKQQVNRWVLQAGKLPAGMYSLRFTIGTEVVSKRFIKVD